MIHLRSIRLNDPATLPERFPFSLPCVRQLAELEFEAPVTFFVGENGSGKSTLLEAMAAATGAVALGGDDIERDDTLQAARALGKSLRCAWNKRTHRGFFLRAEDFFRFARRMAEAAKELGEMATEFESRYTGYGLMLAKGSALGSKAAIESRYGGELDARSHGESFLKLFQSRFVPGGLYLLDEPEAPLSPQRQLALLSMLKEMVETGEAQFVIATHSPILMAFPGATILSFDSVPPKKVPYGRLDHVTLTRDFLTSPDAFLRHL